MKSLKQMLYERNFTLIVSLPWNDMDVARAAIKGGADAIKFHLNVEHRASGNTFGSLEEHCEFFEQLIQEFDGPIGLVPGDDSKIINASELQELEDKGLNYYSVYMKNMPSHMLESGLEKTVAGDPHYSYELLKTMNNSPIDAFESSIIPGEQYGTALSFDDLLRYQSIVDVLDIPVIVPSQKKIIPSDIKHLKNTGVKALMIGAVVTGRDIDEIERSTREIKKAIES